MTVFRTVADLRKRYAQSLSPIERAAFAILEGRNLPDDAEVNWPVFLADAKAVVGSLREPSRPMLNAMASVFGDRCLVDIDMAERMLVAGLDAVVP